MGRTLRFLGALSNLGLKPYDDGRPRGVREAPRVLRELGLVERLGADDLGDVAASDYLDLERPAGGIRNSSGIEDHARRLAQAVAQAASPGAFLLVAGGDCSILLGALLGLGRLGRHGLAFVDGHGDVQTPEISGTGGAAGMDLALALGHFEHPLARLGGGPLTREEDVAVLGRRDLAHDEMMGSRSLPRSRVLDLPWEQVRARGAPAAAAQALERLADPRLEGFWVHFDADVLDAQVMPAVDSPEPDGPSLEQAAELLVPLLAHPRCRGLEVTIYDPQLDPEREYGLRLCHLIESSLRRAGR